MLTRLCELNLISGTKRKLRKKDWIKEQGITENKKVNKYFTFFKSLTTLNTQSYENTCFWLLLCSGSKVKDTKDTQVGKALLIFDATKLTFVFNVNLIIIPFNV